MFAFVFFEPQASLKVSIPCEQIESGVTGHSFDSVFKRADAGSAISFQASQFTTYFALELSSYEA